MIPLWTIPLCLLTGNTLILKPSPQTPTASLLLAHLAEQAGVPAGVFNIVHGGKEIVDGLLEDPRIKGVSFVGGETAGTAIYNKGIRESTSRVGRSLRLLNLAPSKSTASVSRPTWPLRTTPFSFPTRPSLSFSLLLAPAPPLTTPLLPQQQEPCAVRDSRRSLRRCRSALYGAFGPRRCRRGQGVAPGAREARFGAQGRRWIRGGCRSVRSIASPFFVLIRTGLTTKATNTQWPAHLNHLPRPNPEASLSSPQEGLPPLRARIALPFDLPRRQLPSPNDRSYPDGLGGLPTGTLRSRPLRRRGRYLRRGHRGCQQQSLVRVCFPCPLTSPPPPLPPLSPASPRSHLTLPHHPAAATVPPSSPSPAVSPVASRRSARRVSWGSTSPSRSPSRCSPGAGTRRASRAIWGSMVRAGLISTRRSVVSR